jgi:aminoglycoside phosphotransferase (APT) family kinase protein
LKDRQATAAAWAPDIEIGEKLAAALIERQFPELGRIGLEQLGHGWDNSAFLVNRAYVFRFPRRAAAAKLIETEVRLLQSLAGALPLAISVPSFIGEPSPQYPWPFAGYPKLDGVVLSSFRPGDGEYSGLARALGQFLRALHSLDPSPLVDAGLPPDAIGRFDYARTMEKLAARLEDLQAAGLLAGEEGVLAFAQGLAPIAARPNDFSAVHGDLYARHILVNRKLEPTAIIDWGDVHFGDPAIDLTVAYGLIPPSSRAAFFEAYGAADESARRLARYRAIYSSALIAHYGHRIDDADLVYFGSRGLRLARIADA